MPDYAQPGRDTPTPRCPVRYHPSYCGTLTGDRDAINRRHRCELPAGHTWPTFDSHGWPVHVNGEHQWHTCGREGEPTRSCQSRFDAAQHISTGTIHALAGMGCTYPEGHDGDHGWDRRPEYRWIDRF